MAAKQKLYELTPEHRAQLCAWRDRWIANAMSTTAMTDDDRTACVAAVHGLYAAAKLPPPKAVVFVPSPFVLAFAGGFAAAIWHNRRAATRATRDAIWATTEAATEAATRAATEAATRAATRATTEAATEAATRATTEAATEAAWDELQNWYVVPADMRCLANHLGVGDFGLRCAAFALKMWQGGNQWSGYDAYLSFFQDVAGLRLLQYRHYQHWRTLGERSGPRITHPDFCLISDRPEVLTVDETRRPHNEKGPFCRWRDGTAIYSVHGVRIPAWIVERPDRLTIEAISDEQNSEIKRVMIERYGWERYVADVGGPVIDHDERWGTLRRTDGGLVLEVVNRSAEPDGSFRRYILPVADGCEPLPDPADANAELGDPQALTALNAVASTFGLRGEEYARLVGAES